MGHRFNSQENLTNPAGLTGRTLDIDCHIIHGIKSRITNSFRCVRDVYEWSIHSFLQEARMLASLDHPNIVKIIRTFAANGTAYFDRRSATMFHANGCVSSDLVENERTKSQTRRNASIDLIDLRCD